MDDFNLYDFLSDGSDLLGLGDSFLDVLDISQYMDPLVPLNQEPDLDLGMTSEALSFSDVDELQSETPPWDLPGEEEPLGYLSLPLDLNPYKMDIPQAPEDSCVYLPEDYESITPNHTHSRTLSNASASSQEFGTSIKPRPSANAKKRKFEDGLFEFVGIQNPNKKARRRTKLDIERRKEVDQLRKVGACIRCRLTKTRCRIDLPCASCLKVGKSPTLGRALCVRQTLMDVRFTADILGQDRDVSWLKTEITTLYGPKKVLRISPVSFCDQPASDNPRYKANRQWHYTRAGGEDKPWRVAAPLELEIQAFQPRSNLDNDLTGSAIPSLTISDDPELYAIPEKSLPSLETLEVWALNTTRQHRRALVGGFQGAFLSLARRYCECERDLPMKELVWKAVRLSCLHGIWHSGLPQERNSRQEPKRYAPPAVQRQIAIIVSKGIVELEIATLSQLQKTIFDHKGPGKGNMLPIWTCLWLLLLTYRETNEFWSRQDGSGDGLPDLSQHMYDMLVSIYSGLFGPSSPLRLNWLKSDVFDLFGRDTLITERMGALKSEIKATYKEDGRFNHPRDALLRSLILEKEAKCLKSISDPLAVKYIESHMSSPTKAYYDLRHESHTQHLPSGNEPIIFIE
ncbi:hypothetical protein BGZ60DRAFT_395392 [Tricladium varicosporioides]|nr:hypothetical protein BGZ60DRAFT_395392 [Hymenoscyphus varicosporioides]